MSDQRWVFIALPPCLGAFWGQVVREWFSFVRCPSGKCFLVWKSWRNTAFSSQTHRIGLLHTLQVISSSSFFFQGNDGRISSCFNLKERKEQQFKCWWHPNFYFCSLIPLWPPPPPGVVSFRSILLDLSRFSFHMFWTLLRCHLQLWPLFSLLSHQPFPYHSHVGI